MTVVARGPYEAKIPRTDAPRGGYKTAEQELAEALEGTAPHLATIVAGLVGPTRTLELADAVRRATRLAVRRHAGDRLAGALALVEQGLDGIPGPCDHSESLYGRCVACGMTWEEQAEDREAADCTTTEDEADYVTEWLEDTGGNLPPVAKGCVLCDAVKGCVRRPGCPEVGADV